jgi:serine/threonine protein kinase
MTTPASSVTCPHCGITASRDSRFCGNCGGALSGEMDSASGASVSPQGRLSDSGAIELKTLLVAATFGDYDIQDELGRGGMAVVYKATEVHLRRPVAIKILPPDLTFTKGATERFQREAQTAAALDHPNIIPIFRISAGGKLCWYAMKYLVGRSLADILADKGLLTVSETIAILEQVGSALDYAHLHGVVHRDVKPGNVMLDVNGRVTVTDFGIAKELTSGALTGSGAILGTPYYMSPEQCRGSREITGAADQYSLAVMAYQMVCGQLPFDADSAIDVIHKHVSEPPPPLETLLPGLPTHVIDAINRGLSKKPTDRFPTVAAFVSALKHPPDGKTLMMERRPSFLGRRRSGIEKAPTLAGSTRRVSVGLVLIGGLAVGIWWLTTQFVAEPPMSATPGGAAKPTPTDPAGAAGARPSSGRDHSAAPPRVRPPRRAPSGTNRPVPSAKQPTAAAPATAAANPPATTPSGTSPSTGKGFARISISNTWANIVISGQAPRQGRSINDSLPAGNYTVTFERPGYEAQTKPMRVTAGQQISLSVTMQPVGHP